MAAQTTFRDVGGTARLAARIRGRDEEGELRVFRRVRIRGADNILRTVYRTLLAVVSPSTISQTASTSTITTAGAATVTVTGGTAPITYQWEQYLSGDDILPLAPSAASTTFRRTGCISGDTYTSHYICTVTDASGDIAVTDQIVVEVTRT